MREVLKNSILVIQIKSAKNWGMTYLLVLNINWLRGIVFLFRPKELLISPWILPCTLLRRRIMGMWPNMSNGIETNIIPTTIMWDCSTVEVLENYMSAVIWLTTIIMLGKKELIGVIPTWVKPQRWVIKIMCFMIWASVEHYPNTSIFMQTIILRGENIMIRIEILTS